MCACVRLGKACLNSKAWWAGGASAYRKKYRAALFAASHSTAAAKLLRRTGTGVTHIPRVLWVISGLYCALLCVQIYIPFSTDHTRVSVTTLTPIRPGVLEVNTSLTVPSDLPLGR